MLRQILNPSITFTKRGKAVSTADDVFMRNFGAVLGFLVIFAFSVYFIADSVGDESLAKVVSSKTAVESRIAPVGSVVTEGSAEAAAPAAAAPAPAPAPAAPAAQAVAVAAIDGEAVYKEACAVCHVAGVANAPKLDDKAAWSTRAEAGLDMLVKSALNGKGGMPPKGGRMDLADDNIKAAVEYMLKTAGVNAG